jgi:glycosyltransferase involved in cell wall biosynthesis
MHKKVLILPKAGLHNPFQSQLVALLQENGHEICTSEEKNGLAIFRAVRKHKPDIIYFDWIQGYVLSKYLLFTLLKCCLFALQVLHLHYVSKVPIVHTLHNLKNHAGVWIRIEQLVLRFFLPKCKFVRVYSETTKRKVVDMYCLSHERVEVIQDVPFHYHYPNQVSQPQARTSLGLPRQCFVYGFFGLIKPYKGIDDLICSFLQVATHEDFLIIAGPEESAKYTAQLKRLANRHPRILFKVEFLPKEKVQYYINSADIMVLPFRNVEHSGSVDLCMSFKKPIITRRTPLLAAQLSNQDFLLFDKTNELAQRMTEARTLPLGKIGLQNHERAENVNYRDILTLFK